MNIGPLLCYFTEEPEPTCSVLCKIKPKPNTFNDNGFIIHQKLTLINIKIFRFLQNPLFL